MALVFDASCEAGSVYLVDKKTATRVLVPDAIKLSSGELPSVGKLFVLEDGQPFYTTNTQPDVKVTHELIIQLLDIVTKITKTPAPSPGSPLSPAVEPELAALKEVIRKVKLI